MANNMHNQERKKATKREQKQTIARATNLVKKEGWTLTNPENKKVR
jgi:hypothetical protein